MNTYKIIRLSLVACFLTITATLNAQTFDVVIANTKLCGSTISANVYDGATPRNLLASFTCPPGFSNGSLCGYSNSTGTPTDIEFIEGGTCFLAITIPTSSAVTCSSGGGTCGCTCMDSSTPNFQSSYGSPGPGLGCGATELLTITIQ